MPKYGPLTNKFAFFLPCWPRPPTYTPFLHGSCHQHCRTACNPSAGTYSWPLASRAIPAAAPAILSECSVTDAPASAF